MSDKKDDALPEPKPVQRGEVTEMPKYVCNYYFWALAIAKATPIMHAEPVEGSTGGGDAPSKAVQNGALLKFEGSIYTPIQVSQAYCDLFHPEDDGYYIIYRSGALGYMPKDVFEKFHKRSEVEQAEKKSLFRSSHYDNDTGGGGHSSGLGFTIAWNRNADVRDGAFMEDIACALIDRCEYLRRLPEHKNDNFQKAQWHLEQAVKHINNVKQ